MKSHNRQRAERARFNAVVQLAEKKCSQIYADEKDDYIFYVQNKICQDARSGKISTKTALSIMNDKEKWAEYTGIVKGESFKIQEANAKVRENKVLQTIAKNTHWKSVYVAGLIMAVLYQPVGDVYKVAKDAFTKHLGIKQETTQKNPANENGGGNTVNSD